MSAETLRRAAALMRERAEAATPGPWRFTDSEVVDDVWTDGLVVVNGDQQPIASVADEWYEMNEPGDVATVHDAAHIASWHPAVALAVADWLERQADEIADTARESIYGAGAEGFLLLNHPALAVARAYLGAPDA